MSFIKQNILDKVAEPITSANGLPNWFYADDQALTMEKTQIFAPNWVGIGFGKDVPNSGDMKPITFLGQPLLIVRDRQNRIRVFQNTCRHRGVILVEKFSHSSGLIRCPYHAWCYDLDGALQKAPHVGGVGVHDHECIDKSELGLFEIRSHVWFDTIFVNLSGDAENFEDANREIFDRWKDFDHPIYHGGPESSFKLTVQTNWKLAVENYCEAYHLPFVHPGLNQYSRLEDHYNVMGKQGFSGQGSTVYAPRLDDSGRAFTNFPNLPARWNTRSEYLVLYPNIMLGVHRDHVYSIMLEPVSCDTTIEHVEIYYTDPAMCASEWSDLRTVNARQWKDIFIEDIGVVEGMQKGRRGDLFDGGRFSPVLDEATHHFHQWVAKSMTLDF